MNRSDWRETNRKIEECRDSLDPICCLQMLLGETKDGMVAFALAEEYERRRMLAQALQNFAEAEKSFPLKEWKEKAKQAVDRVKQDMTQAAVEEQQKEEPLFVVSCTKRKIWQDKPDAPESVPAREAYKGPDFLEWINDPLSKKTRWVILSAKYGLLEPNHPIANYDVTFDDPKTGPISDQTLINQVKYQCRWKDRRPLNSFLQIVVRGSSTYLGKAKIAFSPRSSISHQLG